MMAFVGAFFAFTAHKSADAKCAKESGFFVFQCLDCQGSRVCAHSKLKHRCDIRTPSELDEK